MSMTRILVDGDRRLMLKWDGDGEETAGGSVGVWSWGWVCDGRGGEIDTSKILTGDMI